MQVKSFYFNPFRECTYLLIGDNNETAIIDCGCSNERERQRLKDFIESNSLSIEYHFLTHAHIDHLWGAQFVFEQYGVLPILSEKDDELFRNIHLQAQMFGLPFSDNLPKEYITLENKATLNTNGDYSLFILQIPLTGIPTPGHTPGGVCYYMPDEKLLFSGDTLFENGIGRTDLPGGNYGTLLKSLSRLKMLPNETVVYPGHGYQTTIGNEKQYNPYL